MGPVLWDLLHIAEFEHQWVNGLGQSPIPDRVNPELRPRATRTSDELGSLDAVVLRLHQVRQEALESLQQIHHVERFPPGFLANLVVQHEAWHQETMVAALNHTTQPSLWPVAYSSTGAPPAADIISVREGSYVIGTHDRSRAYDNERSQHIQQLQSFGVASRPVCNHDLIQFIDSGGYRRAELWSPAGWSWRRECDAHAPGHWRSVDGDWRVWHQGALTDLQANAPAQHLSYFEAEALATWSGGRLPTEAEWEVAATHVLTSASSCWKELSPGAVLDNVYGQVWEWCSDAFLPYPKFEPFPYREYSDVFFGSRYRILRGGCWATHAVLRRPTLRSWDLPQRRCSIFSGVRVFYDA